MAVYPVLVLARYIFFSIYDCWNVLSNLLAFQMLISDRSRQKWLRLYLTIAAKSSKFCVLQRF